MGFLSVLKAIGHGAEKVIGIADTIESNPGVQALESLVLPPGVPKLIQVGLDAITHAQGVAVQAAAAANLTGEQKMAIALSAFNDAYLQYGQQMGLPVEPAKAQAILQAAFALLQEIPSNISLAAPAPGAIAAPSPAPAPEPLAANSLLNAAPAIQPQHTGAPA